MPHLTLRLKITLFLLFFCVNNGLFAQSNFYKFSIGTGFGLTNTYADTKKTLISYAANASLDYYLTPFTTLGAEVQKGKLEGGENNTRYLNRYNTMTFNTKVYAGEFMSARDLNHPFFKSIRGLYTGAGVGIIKNNVDVAERNIYKSKSKEVIFPFNAGINFYFLNHWGYSRFILNLNIQATISLEDGIDDDLNPYSNFNDIYNFFSVGIKYNFGPLGLDRKR
ncbi:outer membrane beta-barrel protein [Pedobacter insulae]|uniref:Outer membrane protein beta-barrel domain-containing protein n=1 Tax=Pedobacter insulae TaxID=414048 RepID=A0A1I2XLT7_9SPHI|nr:outer membrane beta-barrel protein [Pedobacter insulae]SFH13656.1 Outer membrane protein beta-barrel domain-containing protein [Pedobacter insulae]